MSHTSANTEPPLARTEQATSDVSSRTATVLEHATPALANKRDNAPTAQNNLTLPRTPLIGRDHEVATLQHLLLQEQVGLLTLTGPGGIGKTRLALQVAANLLDHFVDGVYVVSLAPISDPELVSATIAQTLCVREAAGRPLQESLQDYLRDKQLLLVLDNFEQILAAAPLVSTLLTSCRRLKVLVTSRAALHLYGEQEFPVPPLALPDAKRLTASLSEYAAIDLFCQRAKSVKPDFALTPDNALDIAKICIGLDGLPLAIELAAARIKLLSPAALLARLDQRLTLLTGGAHDLPTRQRTLRDEIAWSYDLLTPEEQTLFRQLSVFAGGFTLEAAQAVGNAQGDLAIDVLEGVATLVDQTLLKQVESSAGEARFGMLETIREYGLAQLTAANDVTPLQRCHADYFLNLTATAAQYMERKEKKIWLERLQGDYGNLLAALAWLIVMDPPAAQHMARFLWRFWEARGLLSEGRNWLEKALAADTTPTRTRAWALWAKGQLTEPTVDLQHAQELAQECLKIFQTLKDPSGCCEALSLMGYTLMNAGQPTEALPYLEQCLVLARQSAEPDCLAHALVGLGDVYIGLRRSLAQILPLLEESAQLYDELGNLQGLAYTYYVKGRTHIQAGDYTQGIILCQEALALNRVMGSRLDLAYVLTTLGGASWFGGDRVAACVYWEEAQQFFQEANHQAMIEEVRYGPVMVVRYLLKVAGVTFAQRAFDHMTRLLSVVQKIMDNQPPFLDARAQANYQEMLATLCHECPQATFTALWDEGQRLTLAEAVAFAEMLPGVSVPLDIPPWLNTTPAEPSNLTCLDAPAASNTDRLLPAKIPAAGLTLREIEVLRLLVQGLTYAQIADKLVVSRRTVNAHATSIYSKLGVTSRAMATHLAVEQRLV
ncbi:MAG: LuxR C-terminal-related transcriptional regulator [Caldilineaceae bacterium]